MKLLNNVLLILMEFKKKVTEQIKNLATLGRKHKLNLTLIVQGIVGEIGINAVVRRNLHTNFYGRLHPLDASIQEVHGLA
jgi:hypothetical protein